MLTEKQINKINKKSPYEYGENEQGIFTEPYGIPDTIKEPVVYMRWSSGGVSGGSCWDSSNPQRYTNDNSPEFKALDLTLEIIDPNITYLTYKKIEKLICSSEETDWEYYGNCTDYEIKYIILSRLIKLIEG